MQIKTMMKYHFIASTLAKSKNLAMEKCLRGCRLTECFVHCYCQ